MLFTFFKKLLWDTQDLLWFSIKTHLLMQQNTKNIQTSSIKDSKFWVPHTNDGENTKQYVDWDEKIKRISSESVLNSTTVTRLSCVHVIFFMIKKEGTSNRIQLKGLLELRYLLLIRTPTLPTCMHPYVHDLRFMLVLIFNLLTYISS